MKTTGKIAGLALMASMLLTGCGEHYDVLLWTSFGSAYTTALDALIADVNELTGFVVKNETQKSYPQLQTNINNSISTDSYPNIAMGYPDHFAGYIKSNIQLALDSYIKAYDEEHGGSLLDDYYPEYMVENQTLKYNINDEPYTMGLPFNKSTEVIAYNGYFVDYAASINADLATLPDTWDEWNTKGEQYMAVMDTLFGKKLYGVINDDDSVSGFQVVEASAAAPSGKELLLDMTKVAKTRFKLLAWDALDNMFITLCRQWGGVYTSYTAQDRKNNGGKGWARFFDTSYTMDDGTVINPREITTSMLNYMKDLHAKDIIGMPSEINEGSYASDAFKYGRTMFVICSSGGLSHNILGDFEVRVHAIPYKDAAHKKVISQGTNLALFDQGDEETWQKGFDAIVALTKGDIQGRWAAETGYFPATKSATNSQVYQDLLNKPQKSMIKKVYQRSAKLNNEVYSDAAQNWDKFVDPGFIGSSQIRTAVEPIITMLFGNDKTIEQIFKKIMPTIRTYVSTETMNYIDSLPAA